MEWWCRTINKIIKTNIMAKIRTTGKINWGGFNPAVLNNIEIESVEVLRTSEEIVYQITDTVIGEREYLGENDEVLIDEYPFQVIRNKRLSISVAQFNQLYEYIDANVLAGLTPFEKEERREKEAMLYFYRNDRLSNNMCGYNTLPEQWV